MDAPSGTTAQRPGSPATGSLYFDTDLGSLVSYNGTEWASVGGGGLELDEFTNEYYSTLHMYVNSDQCKGEPCGGCAEASQMCSSTTKYNSLMARFVGNCCQCYGQQGCGAVGPCSCVWWRPPGGSAITVPGEVQFCYRGGMGGIVPTYPTLSLDLAVIENFLAGQTINKILGIPFVAIKVCFILL